MDKCLREKGARKTTSNGLQMHYMRFNLRPVWGTGLNMGAFSRRRMGFTTMRGFLFL